MRYITDEPIAAIATPLVPSAIGIIRTSGKDAIELVSRIFSRPAALLKAKSFTLVHGWITADGKKLDEVLLAVFRAPDGFTAEDAVEIYCHGGLAIIQKIFTLVISSGFRQAFPGEFTFRSFANGKTDLTRAEAVREIIEAKTYESSARAAKRLSGDLFKTLDAIKLKLLNLRARMEAETEYPEDENAFTDISETNVYASVLEEIETELLFLCDSWRTEKVFQDGVRIVLAGKTNSGKSSLFNALLKQERSIVSDVHGTTRDWLEAHVDFAGLPVRLFDTAGLRETLDEIEAAGVKYAKELALNADIIFYLIDITAAENFEPSPEDKAFFAANEKVPLIKIFTKCDLLKKPPTKKDESYCFVSVKNSQGLAQIAENVRRIVFQNGGGEYAKAEHALGSERQKEAAFGALEAVRHALSAFNDGFGADAICEDIDDALLMLGEITGEICTEDILDAVFSKFCLGK